MLKKEKTEKKFEWCSSSSDLELGCSSNSDLELVKYPASISLQLIGYGMNYIVLICEIKGGYLVLDY